MSSRSRLAIVAVAVVALVIAFVVAESTDDSDKPPTRSTPATSTPAAPGKESSSAGEILATIRVHAGKPTHGITHITATKGDRIRLNVSSDDTSDEIHVHGYDLMKDLKAPGAVHFNFIAKSDGIYEIELESAKTQIAELEVRPGLKVPSGDRLRE